MNILLYIVVIAASITPCFLDFGDEEIKKQHNKNIMAALQMFNVIFLVEAVLKIIAYGLYEKSTSYFRSRGNWLEFFLAAVGLVQLLLGNLYQAEIRVMLSLRPARIAIDVKSMRRIVSVIEKSVKELFGVGALMIFAIFIFSVVGKG